ncbi:hypothetical protein R4Z10_10110 [Niallia sp. XMNu-256]|uniref:hypothetical protein n=1 Tax=Niallia sp. XMNu-256 TaxID=3082444 RepID=UPI0030CCBA64
MKVVIYRNIKGVFQSEVYKWWKSFASKLGFMLEEHAMKNTRTITVFREEEEATFMIFHSKIEPQLYLNYLRIETEDPLLVELFDRLIQRMSLSGEKHIIENSVRTSTFFKEGLMIDKELTNNRSKFELKLIKETILGFIHLSLDRMVEIQRSGNMEKITEIKETIASYQEWLNKINEEINSK